MRSLALKTGMAAAMLVVPVIAVLAFSPGFQQGQTKEPTGSISGTVTIGGAAARGVAVLLLTGEDGPIERPLARATTDSEGHYQMTGVPAGQHFLQAFAPALVAGPSYMGRSGKIINITAGEALDSMDIALTRGAAITGRITDADGQPLIQENVRLLEVNEQGRQVPIFVSGIPNMYVTDDRGIYRLFGIPPGRYILSVGNPSGTTTRMGNSANKFYPVTYHPGVTDEAKAKVVEVVAGSEATDVDIVLGQASRAYSVSGRIIDAATGKPLLGVQYGYGWLDREDRLNSISFANSTSGTRGEFRLDGVAPGRYSAFASPQAETEMYSDTAAFTVSDSDVAGIEIKVHRGSSISGTVIIEGAEDQPGAPRLSDLRVSVSSGSLNVAPMGRSVTVAADGSFRTAGLPRGIANFRLAMYPPPKGLSFLRMERDGVEQKNGIEVGLAEEISGVKVIFGYGTGAIRGQVEILGGEIPPRAIMYVMLQQLDAMQRSQYSPPQPFRRPTVPDSRGRFVVDGLLPGEYDLRLTYEVLPVGDISQTSPKIVTRRVTVNNGAETQVTIVIDPNAKDQ